MAFGCLKTPIFFRCARKAASYNVRWLSPPPLRPKSRVRPVGRSTGTLYPIEKKRVLPPRTVHFFYHPSQFIFYHPSQFVIYHPSQFVIYHPSQFIFYHPSKFIFYHPSQFIFYHPSQFVIYHPSQFIFYHPSQFIFYHRSQFIFYHPSQFSPTPHARTSSFHFGPSS